MAAAKLKSWVMLDQSVRLLLEVIMWNQDQGQAARGAAVMGEYSVLW